jgi:hypothetical protein
MFKQVRRMYGDTFDHEERIEFRVHIHEFVLLTLRNLFANEEDDEELIFIKDLGALSDKAQAGADVIRTCGTAINSEIASAIKDFWSDELVKTAFEEYANINLAHTCKNFIEDVDRIAADDYVPTDQDILWQRRTTAGLIEQKLVIDDTSFMMVDVGGQKSERRKWAHQFTEVSVVVFVVSLSSFDEAVWEDENANGLDIALQVFDVVCNTEWLVRPNIVLFFNKEDLFKEKINGGTELSRCPAFADYEGAACDSDAALEAITGKFKKKFSESKMSLRQSVAPDMQTSLSTRELYVEVTCAYDEDSIKVAFGKMIKAMFSSDGKARVDSVAGTRASTS